MGFDLNSSWVLVVVLISGWVSQICYGLGTFGFDMHHRFSDPVKGILDVDDLPEKLSLQYYKAMAHRDWVIHGRRLSTSDEVKPPLTFSDGNETYRLSSLGYLHYANVSLGTPSLWFLVALDTGSDLFWLPCDCTSCIKGLNTTSGKVIDFNIYSPNASSTSINVPCNSTLCQHKNQCSATDDTCPYQISYLSNGTSSTGFLVEDMLHLVTDDDESKGSDAQITFGCGKVQTGSFLEGAAPNGLFGLGMGSISVPSILAKEGLVADSFSMCFGNDGTGRISFGDEGSSGQEETPFNPSKSQLLYNISITQISVGGTSADLNFDAIFDSGTSFTYLNDPAYTSISESFNLRAKDKRHSSNSDLPFEYCYDISEQQTTVEYPIVNLTMKGGDNFFVTDPIVIVSIQGGYVYCLGVVKSGDINIIGQNFMTGYRIIFDREKMVLGWTKSNCYDTEESNTLPINPANSPVVPPTVSVEPEATAGNGNGSHISEAPSPLANGSPTWNSFILALLMVFLPILASIL
ncbi:Aspartyl protease family protein 1 [Vitis vinifera]|uniref:Aspartyl protease family protein 1 n=1 Tax=Vitis vinifera TaxID=29760 RepID=A0A438K622_VITVI|nr:Aspartyl protease family protein 1 [Vitis vinifera]